MSTPCWSSLLPTLIVESMPAACLWSHMPETSNKLASRTRTDHDRHSNRGAPPLAPFEPHLS
ncbi:hypothetical protein JI435_423130 [Parastagonospora nodorum SN15]|uniref:Uncharacterized protein n=1 Tax=Phaeosphaeria nodorum (strain SN15 / ATCC MYA-4574 / FGSC 10173) TaxID=321614 RepID=A0A7U2IAF5_PHANO|nr:hypothetical protein JI435_423130 [Parastagonospora nodorum SN15]